MQQEPQVHRYAVSGTPLVFVWVTVPDTNPVSVVAACWLPRQDAILDDDVLLLRYCCDQHPALKRAGSVDLDQVPWLTLPAISLAFDPADYFQSASAWRAPDIQRPLAASLQTRVGGALRAIAVGDVQTYAHIAGVVQSGPRAVGQACRRNPWPVFLPCHRVVPAQWRADGVSGGYAGERVGALANIKQWLLAHERLVYCQK